MSDRPALSVLISPFNNIIIDASACTYILYLLYVDDGRRFERCYRHVFRTRWTQPISRNHGKIIPLHELNTRQQVSYYYYYCMYEALKQRRSRRIHNIIFFHTHIHIGFDRSGPIKIVWTLAVSRTIKIFITNNVTI